MGLKCEREILFRKRQARLPKVHEKLMDELVEKGVLKARADGNYSYDEYSDD